MMYAPSLLDPAADELRLADVVGRGATEVAREARTLLGERFSSVTFMYVLMRAFEVEYTAACDASRWHEFHGGPRALSDADLEKLLAPWLAR
ncbi:hypothetical protein [Amycolatopsis sp. NBC_01480]|uniref:hypothetical protein n=1 Tax=Amycolatopsis sp. NBC_01480 TaxID=2903562 RepID=UPI002E2CD734|nr:hypothetical protein [Amycolatopsis sp. NBC_01480]